MEYKKKLREFLPRNQRLENFPKNTEKEIFIPIDSSDYRFEYINENKFNDYLSKNEINRTINIINKDLDKVIISKKLEEKKDYNKWNNKIIFVEFILGIFTLFMTVLTFSIPDFQNAGFYTILTLIIIMICLSVFVIFKVLKDDEQFSCKNYDVYKKLKEVLERENNKYANKKIKWSSVPEMYYLKIEIMT